jgi:GTP cyclohydrolase I
MIARPNMGVSAEDAEKALKTLLSYVGEDYTREGLLETPKRVVKAWREMTEGYIEDPAEILAKVFPSESSDNMVLVRGIPFVSMCEHHCLPFTGAAHVAYFPSPGNVVGLSKLARLVHCFAKRLQVQERLTQQITHALMEHLQPLGAACVIEATHSCMSLRGVRAPATMVTSSLQGNFLQPTVRAEFLALVRG